MLHMTALPPNRLPFAPSDIRMWIARWPFSRFVTLTLNSPGMGKVETIAATASHMRDRLYQFDARMNRKLIGRDWQRRPDNRMFHFFAPEKLATNPHWHGLVYFFGAQGSELRRQEDMFDRHADSIWSDLVPKGSADVKAIYDLPGGVDYVAKSLPSLLNWDYCIFPDEFWAMHL